MRRVKIKICGIRRNEDVEIINTARPDYVGMIFAPNSHRYVEHENAVKLSHLLSANIIPVGVFVNMPIEEAAAYSDAVRIFQLHGDENEDYIKKLAELIPDDCEIWKAVRVRSVQDISEACRLSCSKLLLDAFSPDSYGGTGKQLDISLLKGAEITKPFFLAGGVSAENLPELYAGIHQLSPFGFDLSSSVETDGFKDRDKITALMAAADRL